MSLMWIIYLANMADNLSVGLVMILVATIVAIIIFGIRWIGEKDFGTEEKAKANVNGIKKSSIIGLIIIILLTILPSSNAIYLMVGTQQIENLSSTPEGMKVKEALDLGLDKVINKLKEGNKS